MTLKIQTMAVAAAAMLAAGVASAQVNIVKAGVSRYTTDSRTNGVSGVGVPAGADAETGDATTVILAYERMINPNVAVELVLGIPPKITGRATGSVAFLGDVLSARSVSPTAFVNYHFGTPGDTWRPYLGAGVNYTKFADIQSNLAPDVEMSDSFGWAAQAGIDYSINKQWGAFASVAVVKVKSKLVAAGSTVLQTTIDFRPVVYTIGVAYKF
jgi:outer membrane protein